MGLVTELLKDFEFEIGSLNIVPSDGGRFEVTINGETVYSKLQTGRHAEPGEVLRLVRAYKQKKS